MRRFWLLALAVSVAPPLLAQGTPATSATARVPSAADSAVLRALDLPGLMQRARDAGAPDSSLRAMVDLMRGRGIPAEEATKAVELEVDAVEAGDRPENFGSFVRAQVESGVRGQELAASIRAERARRGMGPGRPAGAGRPATAGPAEGRGRPEGAGRPAGAGRADSAGRPATQGKRP